MSSQAIQKYPKYRALRRNSTLDFPKFNVKRTAIYSILSVGIWVLILVLNNTLVEIAGSLVMVLLLFQSFKLIRRSTVDSLSILAYLAVLQPAMRNYLPPLPYLMLEYFFIGWALIVIGNTRSKKIFAPAIFYGIYMLLETIGIISAIDPENVRSIYISSLSILFAVLIMKRIVLKKKDVVKIISGFMVGGVSLLAIILYGYVTNPIQWEGESNFAASGNMGPVHISMLLAIIVFLLGILIERYKSYRRLFIALLMGAFSIAMVLTFSRSGLYLAVVGLLIYYLVFSKLSASTFFSTILIVVLGLFIFGLAVDVAGTTFVDRFSDYTPTNRLELIEIGWNIFLDNPIFGVGTSNYSRVVARAEYYGEISGAHNELIRAAAEHGILGLVSWSLFAITSFIAGYSHSGNKARGLRMALLALFFAYSSVNGIKLFAQPLLLLIAFSVDEF